MSVGTLPLRLNLRNRTTDYCRYRSGPSSPAAKILGRPYLIAAENSTYYSNSHFCAIRAYLEDVHCVTEEWQGGIRLDYRRAFRKP